MTVCRRRESEGGGEYPQVATVPIYGVVRSCMVCIRFVSSWLYVIQHTWVYSSALLLFGNWVLQRVAGIASELMNLPAPLSPPWTGVLTKTKILHAFIKLWQRDKRLTIFFSIPLAMKPCFKNTLVFWFTSFITDRNQECKIEPKVKTWKPILFFYFI